MLVCQVIGDAEDDWSEDKALWSIYVLKFSFESRTGLIFNLHGDTRTFEKKKKGRGLVDMETVGEVDVKW